MVTKVPISYGGTGESTQAGAQAALGLHSSNSVTFTAVTIGSVNVLANDYATYTTLSITVQNNSSNIYTAPSIINFTGSTSISNTGSIVNVAIGVSRIISYPDATSITFNTSNTDIATQNNTQTAGTLTINIPTGNPVDGQKLMFRLKSANVQTLSWNASGFASGTDVTLPTSSTGNSKQDYMGFIYNSDATKWHIVAKAFGY